MTLSRAAAAAAGLPRLQPRPVATVSMIHTVTQRNLQACSNKMMDQCFGCHISSPHGRLLPLEFFLLSALCCRHIAADTVRIKSIFHCLRREECSVFTPSVCSDSLWRLRIVFNEYTYCFFEDSRLLKSKWKKKESEKYFLQKTNSTWMRKDILQPQPLISAQVIAILSERMLILILLIESLLLWPFFFYFNGRACEWWSKKVRASG